MPASGERKPKDSSLKASTQAQTGEPSRAAVKAVTVNVFETVAREWFDKYKELRLAEGNHLSLAGHTISR